MGNAKQTSQKISQWKSHWSIPFVVILVYWLIFCSPYFFQGLIPFPSKFLVTFFPPWNAEYAMPVKNGAMPDVITQIFPWKYLTIHSWKNGQVPLWNPYSFSGTHQAGNYQSAVFSPFNLLYFVLPFIDAWSVNVLFQPLLAGVFTYLLVFEITRHKTASLIGAAGFMFSGFITTWMAYGTLGMASVWLPLCMFVIIRANRVHAWYHYALVSLCIALSLTSGHFQISLYVIGASIAGILFFLVSTKNLKENMVLFFSVCLGILIAAPQITLTFHAYVQTVRSGSFIKGEVIPWNYLVTIFAPDFFGNPVTRNDWFGHYAEWASYIGVMPLIFAVYTLSRKITRIKLLFLVLFGISLMLAYQTPFVDLLFALKIPVLSTSAASRILVVMSFSLSVLAALGFTDLVRDLKVRLRTPFYRTAAIWAFLLITIWVYVTFLHPYPYDKMIIAKRNILLPSAISIFGLVLIGFAFLHGRFSKILQFVLLVVCLFDSYRFASKWMPFDPREYMYPNTGMLSFLQSISGHDRVFGNIGGEVGLPFEVQLVDGYDAMYQSRYGMFAALSADGVLGVNGRSTVAFDKTGRYAEKLFQLLGVKYFVHKLSDGHSPWAYPIWRYSPDEMRSVYKDANYEIFEYTKAYPRAMLMSSYAVARSDDEIVHEMLATGINLRDTVLLEKNPLNVPASGSGTVRITSYTPNSVELETTSESPKMLFLSDVYDTGWQATVDGVVTEIYRADYDFRAISVPKGNHRVLFLYRPLAWKNGIIISVISLILIVSMSFYYYAHRNIQSIH